MDKGNLSQKDWERIIQSIGKVDCDIDFEFQYWLNEDIERLEVYTMLMSLSNNSKIVTPEEIELKRSAWTAVLERNSLEDVSERKGVKVKRQVFFGIAAAVISMMFLSIGYYFGSRGKSVEKTNYRSLMDLESSYDFGKQKVMLVLDNGSTVDLGKTKVIVENDGTILKNKPNQLLAYNATEAKGETSVNTLIIPRGKSYKVLLSDGSLVYMNSGSMLRYPSSFRGKTREVELMGEAYFKVKKNPEKPFIVKVKGVSLSVLGTSFNVDSYEPGKGISTILVEGKVVLSTNDGKNYEMHPNERVEYSMKTGVLEVERNVDVSLYTSWIEGEYRFENQDFESIMNRLSIWYSYEIVFADKDVKDLKFTGVAERGKPIREFLDLLVNLKKISYEVNEGVIFIYKAK